MELALGVKDRAEVHVCLSQARFEDQCLPAARGRVVVPALSVEDTSKIHMRLG